MEQLIGGALLRAQLEAHAEQRGRRLVHRGDQRGHRPLLLQAGHQPARQGGLHPGTGEEGGEVSTVKGLRSLCIALLSKALYNIA